MTFLLAFLAGALVAAAILYGPRLVAWWRERGQARDWCSVCEKPLTVRQAHTLTDDGDLAEVGEMAGGMAGGTSISADYCAAHCPGGCNRGCLTPAPDVRVR